MPRSMTGYGEAETRDAEVVIRVSARSVNNKGFKVNLKLSEPLVGCEADLENAAREHVNRGSLDIEVHYERAGGQPEYKVNAAAVVSYYDHLREIQRQLGISGEVDLSALLALPGSLQRAQEDGRIAPAVLQRIVATVSAALERLVAMRGKEGERLCAEIRKSDEQIVQLLARVEERAPKMVADYQERLRERVNSLLRGAEGTVSNADLCREVALFAERCDVTEEITRLRSHLQQLGEALRSPEAVGRKLEFITQEMFREANTMASKASDPEMLRWIVDLKQEVDKIREQVMNIE